MKTKVFDLVNDENEININDINYKGEK